MVTVTNITFMPAERLGETTQVEVQTTEKGHRVHVQIGFLAMHMTIDQCIDIANALNEKILPILEERQKQQEGEINIQVGDKMSMKDSLQ